MQAPLRFITCGSVDDGKSTLIGRLLYDTRQVADDVLEALARDSRRFGTRGESPDYALLVDGLRSEREQGITIDCAYRYFSTRNRRFIVADTPGHEQYTRNMATGASTADAAVLLVDARKGVTMQTRRHCRIVCMMGVRHLVLAVNKMDQAGWDGDVYSRIVDDFRAFAGTLGNRDIHAIPVCAVDGDNLVARSVRSAWYEGPTLIDYLESITLERGGDSPGLRLPVQYVNRPEADFRGYCGRLSGGAASVGQRVRVVPAGIETGIRSIIHGRAEVGQAPEGACVTLSLEDEVDIARGDVIAALTNPVEVADQFEAHVIWMSDQPLLPGRGYLFKIHSADVVAVVTSIKHLIDIDSGAFIAARELAKNSIAVVRISTSKPIPFEAYARNRRLGAFILVDRQSRETAGAGMIDFALRRSSNIHWQSQLVDKSARAGLKGQKARCVWMTGLSGAGKSTIANLLEAKLHAFGRHTYILDGDNVRHGLNRDLGFTEAARVENIRRVAEVAKLMVDAGLIVIVSFISPYRAEREFARSLFAPTEFFEVHVDAPLAECERRDPKGLYAKARRGELANFTGIDSVYEPPDKPDVRLETAGRAPEESAEVLLRSLAL
jgi:bifunctional enzyme CysN/CysC